MTTKRLDNLRAMRAVSDNKKDYGIRQIEKLEFSASSKLSSDRKASDGKHILRQKIYANV